MDLVVARPRRTAPLAEVLLHDLVEALRNRGVAVDVAPGRPRGLASGCTLLFLDASRPEDPPLEAWLRIPRLAVVELRDPRLWGRDVAALPVGVFAPTAEGIRAAILSAVEDRRPPPLVVPPRGHDRERLVGVVLGAEGALRDHALPLAAACAFASPCDLATADALRRALAPDLPFCALQRVATLRGVTLDEGGWRFSSDLTRWLVEQVSPDVVARALELQKTRLAALERRHGGVDGEWARLILRRESALVEAQLALLSGREALAPLAALRPPEERRVVDDGEPLPREEAPSDERARIDVQALARRFEERGHAVEQVVVGLSGKIVGVMRGALVQGVRLVPALSNAARSALVAQATVGIAIGAAVMLLGITREHRKNREPSQSLTQCQDKPRGTSCEQGGGKLCDGDGHCVECLERGDCETDQYCVQGYCTDALADDPETTSSLSPAVQRGCASSTDCIDGGVCDRDSGECVGCLLDANCKLGLECSPKHLCVFSFSACDDGMKNGKETDVDCGGGECVSCTNGKRCVESSDCHSKVCVHGVCQKPTCSDGVKNGDEGDVDCGGSMCPRCAAGRSCWTTSDCGPTLICTQQECEFRDRCHNGILDGDETDVDCGGSCPPCGVRGLCKSDKDCAVERGARGAVPLLCTERIDVYRYCNNHCHNRVRDGDETDVDCGGSCPPCQKAQECEDAMDCAKGLICAGGFNGALNNGRVRSNGRCVAPLASPTAANQDAGPHPPSPSGQPQQPQPH